MIDSFGREINYARISVTDLCNLRCRYCMPEDGVCKKPHSGVLSIEGLTAVASALAECGIEKIRITGGEPLVRKGIDDFFENLSKMPFKKKTLTTNGILLPAHINKLKDCGFSAINVSIDSLSEQKYRLITRNGDLKDALTGVKCAKEAGFEVKVNAVLMKGVNDDEINDFITFAAENDVTVRFIELMPFTAQESFAKDKFLSADEVLARFPQWRFEGNNGSETAEYYTAENGAKIGFIRPLSRCFCSQCNRIRITADGKLMLCLHSNKMHDLTPYLHGGMAEFIEKCVSEKPQMHSLAVGGFQNRGMNTIGG
jgi:cyclic pyranopterin phosphate synthase